MRFFYKVQKKNGEIMSGYLDSGDRYALAKQIREGGDLPLVVREAPIALATPAAVNAFLSHVSLREKVIFVKNLSGMLFAGLPLSRALSVLERQSGNPALKKILASVLKDIDRGQALSDSFEKFPKVFPQILVSMVRSGEESGNLPKVLAEVGANMEKSYILTKKVKGAMTYPLVIITAVVAVGTAMFIFVVPTLTKTFTELGAELPATTRAIVSLSDFLQNHFLLALSCLFGAGTLLFFLTKISIFRRALDFFWIKLPVIKDIAIPMNVARACRTISSLLSSGVAMVRAISIARDVVQNVHYKEALARGMDEVEKGVTLSQVFKEREKLFTPMAGEMLAVGEETGRLSDMLLQIADFYEADVDNKTKNLSTIIEPLLMLLVGAGVGFFALSMLSPLYSILDKIK